MHEISRQELFDAAWTRPLVEVASDFGVTSTALKKTCSRYDIPTPSRGYWAQVRAGRTFPRPKLRPVKDPRQERVVIFGAPPLPDAVHQRQAQTKAALAAEAPAPATPIGERRPSPLLAATHKAATRAKPDSDGFVRVSGAGVVPLAVGEASLTRALEALETLVSTAADLGYQLVRSETGMALEVDGVQIRFRLGEKTDPHLHVPTSKELAEKVKQERWGWTRDPWPKYDHLASGRLTLAIEGNDYSGLRRTYSETQAKRMDAMVGDILVAFAGHAALTLKRRREAEDARLAAEKAERQRLRIAAFEAREAQRMAFVDLIGAKLAERAKLAAVLAHVEGPAAGEQLAPMVGWLKLRLTQIEALLGPVNLEISSRHARIDFDEGRARAKAAAEGRSYYYPPKAELLFWAIDAAGDRARGQSALDWAVAAGHLPSFEAD